MEKLNAIDTVYEKHISSYSEDQLVIEGIFPGKKTGETS